MSEITLNWEYLPGSGDTVPDQLISNDYHGYILQFYLDYTFEIYDIDILWFGERSTMSWARTQYLISNSTTSIAKAIVFMNHVCKSNLYPTRNVSVYMIEPLAQIKQSTIYELNGYTSMLSLLFRLQSPSTVRYTAQFKDIPGLAHDGCDLYTCLENEQFIECVKEVIERGKVLHSL